MRILLLCASVFFIGLYLASWLLKFMRTTVLNCLSVKKIKWNTVQLKFLENKIAVELTALTVQLVIIPSASSSSASASAGSRNVTSATVPNSESRNVNDSDSNSNRSRTVQTSQNSSTDSAINTISTISSIISSIISVLITAGKTLLSYLFSCFTIVLTDSVLELNTIDGEQMKVRKKEFYVMLCYVMLCNVMLRYIMLCHVM